ncbi:MAG: hypothetical protein GX804_00390, partial [Lentisphaerae bacterium]|nr:hypothetical protein [Lentisphaerota bacterium]
DDSLKGSRDRDRYRDAPKTRDDSSPRPFSAESDRRQSYRDDSQRKGPHRQRSSRAGGHRSQSSLSELPYDIRFLPGKKELTGIAEKVLTARRAFPLRDLVRLFFKNPEFTEVRLAFNDENQDKSFYRCTKCNWFAMSEEEARSHLLTAHFAEYFDSEEQEIDPPSGNFVSVARCGLSGKLLAPPNHHSYNLKIQQMLRTEFAGMDAEEYRARIEIISDPEMIEQWRNESSKVIAYFLKERKSSKKKRRRKQAAKHEESKVEETVLQEENAEDSEPNTSEEVIAVPEEQYDSEQEAGQAQESDIVQETSVEQIHDESDIDSNAAESDTEIESEGEQESISDESDAGQEQAKRMSQEEAETYFFENIAGNFIRAARQVTVSNAVSKALSDKSLLDSIGRAWDREQAIQTASLFFAIRGGLRSRKLFTFRTISPRGEEFVYHKQPTMLDVEHAVPSLKKIIDYIKENKGCTRNEMLSELITDSTPQDETDEIQKQVAFVTERGYVIEYFNGVLALPEEYPYFSKPRKPKKADKIESESATVEKPVEEVSEETKESEPSTEVALEEGKVAEDVVEPVAEAVSDEAQPADETTDAPVETKPAEEPQAENAEEKPAETELEEGTGNEESAAVEATEPVQETETSESK